MMPDLQQINLADLRPKARLIPAEVIQVACQKRPGAVLFQQRQHGFIIFINALMLCINFRIQKTDRKIPERERLRWNLGNNFSAAAFSACTI